MGELRAAHRYSGPGINRRLLELCRQRCRRRSARRPGPAVGRNFRLPGPHPHVVADGRACLVLLGPWPTLFYKPVTYLEHIAGGSWSYSGPENQ